MVRLPSGGVYYNEGKDKENINPFMEVVSNDGDNFTIYRQGQISICGEYIEYDLCAMMYLVKEFVLKGT